MSINVKKCTKDQMAKMVEEAQEATEKMNGCMNELRSRNSELELQVRALKAKNVALTEKIIQMNGEAITRENVIANLKADADVLRNKLADTEAALGRANDDLAFKGTVIDVMRNKRYNAEQRANYAEAHPWRNLWAWAKRKMARHE